VQTRIMSKIGDFDGVSTQKQLCTDQTVDFLEAGKTPLAA